MRPFTKLFFFFALFFSALNLSAQQRYTAELFIEIREAGKFEVSVNDEQVISRSGRFRFYEVPVSSVIVTISTAGKVIYRGNVQARRGLRTIAGYSRAGGFKVISDLDIYQDNRYALDSWNEVLYANGGGRPDGYSRPGLREMRPEEFSQLAQSVKKEAFDDGKIRVIGVALLNNRISVGQLTELLKTMSFDDNKLKAAQNAYASVVDRNNFYLLRTVFSFDSTRQKLDEFLLKQG